MLWAFSVKCGDSEFLLKLQQFHLCSVVVSLSRLFLRCTEMSPQDSLTLLLLLYFLAGVKPRDHAPGFPNLADELPISEFPRVGPAEWSENDQRSPERITG